ncbi:tRNA1(Val) (adenine(37)-N6)-methyltransferase [Anditalea andensis]|uniref:tRNA1(Val) (adenine(37)-N6)-methyltransferase n=1 Tax=Anditalea andensis TaxID=1048983 RepID=A0A074L1J1_9BACT|nr:methyltransferase [Anditalea andensis]KEO73713.1 hypothetical protein EL17_10810 [Anditalea andensis]
MKTIRPFTFKQFIVKQDQCALKVNTDAVLLGALAETVQPEDILDIGAGTGVISLMLAQRYPYSNLSSVEIEYKAFLQAKDNFENSPWSDRMQVFHIPFQEYVNSLNGSKKYDLIVSNPPYYHNHLKSLTLEKNIALHSDLLTFEELSVGIAELLSPQGKFYAILPPVQMKRLEICLSKQGLYPHEIVEVKDRPATKPIRLITSFAFGASTSPYHVKMNIKDDNGNYAETYASLLQDFLIIF